MSEQKVAIVILNYNGKHFLERYLPSVLLYSKPYKIVVADNGSKDGSLEFMREHFPKVIVIENKANLGYAGGYNAALSQLGSEYYVLLNSDVEVSHNWLEPMLELMENDPSVAACQPKLKDQTYRDKFEYAGACGGYVDWLAYPFCRGRIFQVLETDKGQYNQKSEVFWASGACLMLRADPFWKAGALDEDFFAHMEEIDLCWRLKNLGYKIYCEPGSTVYHLGAGTLKKESTRKTYLNFRNSLSTIVKNDKSVRLPVVLFCRLFLDGIAGLKFLFEGRPAHLFAILMAHFSFYYHLPSLFVKRSAMRIKPGFKYDRSRMYKGSLLTDYYIRRKRLFSELNKGFFTD
ncbi:MAG TPA: glycosyltransferase [Bacteroidia bacterium]|nr:glycosyltransferase [Bacteroidia bacterium]